MNNFIQESLNPTVFWGAFSAVCTAVGIIIALLLPIYQKYKRHKDIENLIKAEMIRNYKIAKHAGQEHSITLPNGTTQKVMTSKAETMRLINMKFWHEYKYKLADNNPQSYNKFNEVYQHLESIDSIETLSKDKKIKDFLYLEEIKSFVEKCSKLDFEDK